MVTKVYAFITDCWGWMPVTCIGMISLAICIKFGDSVLGMLDRAYRLIGR